MRLQCSPTDTERRAWSRRPSAASLHLFVPKGRLFRPYRALGHFMDRPNSLPSRIRPLRVPDLSAALQKCRSRWNANRQFARTSTNPIWRVGSFLAGEITTSIRSGQSQSKNGLTSYSERKYESEIRNIMSAIFHHAMRYEIHVIVNPTCWERTTTSTSWVVRTPWRVKSISAISPRLLKNVATSFW